MISYRDRTFCYSDCVNEKCPRYESEEVSEGAQKAKLPIALSDFSENCDDYMPGRTK